MITEQLHNLAGPAGAALMLIAGIAVLILMALAGSPERPAPVVGRAAVPPPFLDPYRADVDTVPIDRLNGRDHRPHSPAAAARAAMVTAPRPATTCSELAALYALPAANRPDETRGDNR